MNEKEASGAKNKSVSRRHFLTSSCTGIALAGTAVLPAWAAGERGFVQLAQRAKQSKAAANYQDQPKGSQQCSGCSHFRGPSSCEIVDGTISPNGWCKNFRAKSGSSRGGSGGGGSQRRPSGGSGGGGSGY